MTGYNKVDSEMLLAEWLLQHYFVTGSYYYTCVVGTGSKVYRHIKQAITINQIIRHLTGEISVAAPSAHDRTVVSISVDVDSLDIALVARARDALRRQNLPVVTSFSGKKGYHFTVFLNKATPLEDAQSVSRKIQNVLNLAGIKYDKISPSPSGNGGDALTIPLGLHPETRKVCYYLDNDLNPVTDSLSFLNSVITLEPEIVHGTTRVEDKATGEVKTTFPKVISLRPCINKLWNEGLQAPHTRHEATLVIANAVQRSKEISAADKEDAIIDWENRTFEKAKAQGYIELTTTLVQAVSEAQRLLKIYGVRNFAELCENTILSNGMRSACVDEYGCKLAQNRGSVNIKLMKRLGFFVATNAKLKGLGKVARAVYEDFEDIAQEYHTFTWNGHQVFSLSVQELIGLSRCTKATAIKQRNRLLEVGLLAEIPRTEIPAAEKAKHPYYARFYYLPEINDELIKSVLNKLRGEPV